MKLTYRGVSYEYNPPAVETVESQAVGKYRGLDWRFRNPKKALVLETNLDLKYRGAAYRAHTEAPVAAETAQVEPTKAPVLSTENRARSLMMNHQRAIKNRQQALLSRSAAEVGLSANISEYWNRIQGKVHPTFRINYDRSHAALS